MSEYTVNLEWNRSGQDFGYEKYSRDHTLSFGAKYSVRASSAPDYFGNPECVNPEQTFAASLASCHMLTFLALASRRGFVVDSYQDEASSELGKNDKGQIAITNVRLRPVVTFASGQVPTEEKFAQLQSRAHDHCFIANSVASCVKVVVEARMRQA